MIKRIATIGIIIGSMAINATAQNNTSSPYTRYGYGDVMDPGYGQNTAMGGLSVGLRSMNFTNPGNPASYTAIDTLNFRIEAGVSCIFSKYSDGKDNARESDGNLEYIALHFPIKKWLATSIGIRPYSFVGYDNLYSVTEKTDMTNDTLVSRYEYYGQGGINQLYLGIGLRPFKAISLGANLLYHFGTIEHNSLVSFNKDYIYSTHQTQRIKVNDLCANFGIQASFKTGKEQHLDVGFTYQIKSELKSDATKNIITSDTTMLNYANLFDTPASYGIGFVYHFNNRLLAGFDYKHTSWSDIRFFGEKPFEDVNKFVWGLEYLPDVAGRKYYQRMYYRCGLNVSKSYYKINEQRTNKLAIDAGLGFPLKKGSNPTVINLGFEYGQNGESGNGLVKEQYFKGTINVTINERWFVKRKLD